MWKKRKLSSQSKRKNDNEQKHHKMMAWHRSYNSFKQYQSKQHGVKTVFENHKVFTQSNNDFYCAINCLKGDNNIANLTKQKDTMCKDSAILYYYVLANTARFLLPVRMVQKQ